VNVPPLLLISKEVKWRRKEVYGGGGGIVVLGRGVSWWFSRDVWRNGGGAWQFSEREIWGLCDVVGCGCRMLQNVWARKKILRVK